MCFLCCTAKKWLPFGILCFTSRLITLISLLMNWDSNNHKSVWIFTNSNAYKLLNCCLLLCYPDWPQPEFSTMVKCWICAKNYICICTYSCVYDSFNYISEKLHLLPLVNPVNCSFKNCSITAFGISTQVCSATSDHSELLAKLLNQLPICINSNRPCIICTYVQVHNTHLQVYNTQCNLFAR